MTKGERNRQLVRLCETMSVTEAAAQLGMGRSAAQKVMECYRNGANVFLGTQEWKPELPKATSVAAEKEINNLAPAIGYTSRMNTLKKTVRVGDEIDLKRYGMEMRLTVCDVFENTVLARDLSDPPCEKCTRKNGDCEERCRNTFHAPTLADICREYWVWFNRRLKYSPTYKELVENNNR